MSNSDLRYKRDLFFLFFFSKSNYLIYHYQLESFSISRDARLDSRRQGRRKRIAFFLLTERLPRFLFSRWFFLRSVTHLRSSCAALGEVSSCTSFFLSTFVDVIHVERPLKMEQPRFKMHTR